jgi:hypothetical protein
MAERSTALNLSAQNSPALNVVCIWTGGGAGDDPLMRGVAALDAVENDSGGVANARQVLFAGIRGSPRR